MIPGTLPRLSPTSGCLLLAGAIGLIACTHEASYGDGGLVTGAEMPLGPLPEAARFLSEGQVRFAVDLHRELALQSPSSNVLHSPWAAWKSLGILSSMGDAEGFASFAYLNGDGPGGTSSGPLARENFEESYTDLSRRVEHSGKHRGRLSDAARIFVDSNLRVSSAGAAELEGVYGLSWEALNFRADPAAAEAAIARWIGGPSVPGPGTLPGPGIGQQTALRLVSKLDFEGEWSASFDPSATAPGAFTRLDGSTVQVPMMSQLKSPRRLTGRMGERGRPSEASFVRLPYLKGAFEMVLIVPAQMDGLPALEAWLTSERLMAGLSSASAAEVPVRMPKLVLGFSQELRPALVALGLVGVFAGGGLDTTRWIAKAQEKHQLSSVLQSVHLRIDEKGTSFKAVTQSDVITASIQMPIVADRPFLFLVRESTSGAVLLMGRIVDPFGLQ